MRPSKNLTGIRFGKLIVLEACRDKSGFAAWSCKCDCGRTKVVKAGDLVCGNVKSCGCLRKGVRNPDAPFNKLFYTYKRSAHVRGIKFSISIEEFKTLINGNCFYCGCAPYRKMIYGPGEIVCNGIDRVDNGLGYERENCVSCCGPCNRIKQNINLNMVEKIFYFIKSKKL